MKAIAVINNHIFKFQAIILEPSIGGIGNKLKNASKKDILAVNLNNSKGYIKFSKSKEIASIILIKGPARLINAYFFLVKRATLKAKPFL